MNLPDVKYAIPNETLTATIEALRDFCTRLEVEAAALAGMKSPEAEKLAQERLEQAKTVEELFDYYTRL